jgi:hypothetical protein
VSEENAENRERLKLRGRDILWEEKLEREREKRKTAKGEKP